MRLWTKVPDEGIHVACASVSFAAAFARQLQTEFTPAALEQRLASMPDRARAGRQRTIIERGFDAPFVKDAVLLFDKTYRAMEVALGDGPWLAGQGFSLADIALTPYLDRPQPSRAVADVDPGAAASDRLVRPHPRPAELR